MPMELLRFAQETKGGSKNLRCGGMSSWWPSQVPLGIRWAEEAEAAELIAQKNPLQMSMSEPLEDEEDDWEPQFAPESEVKARRLKIVKADLEEHGATHGGQKCIDVMAGKDHVRAHSERCHKRFVELFIRTEKYQERPDAEERNMNDSINRINEADLRKLEARLDARDRADTESAVRAADDEAKKEDEVKEAMKFMRSGRPMLVPRESNDEAMNSGSASSWAAPAAPTTTADLYLAINCADVRLPLRGTRLLPYFSRNVSILGLVWTSLISSLGACCMRLFEASMNV